MLLVCWSSVCCSKEDKEYHICWECRVCFEMSADKLSLPVACFIFFETLDFCVTISNFDGSSVLIPTSMFASDISALLFGVWAIQNLLSVLYILDLALSLMQSLCPDCLLQAYISFAYSLFVICHPSLFRCCFIGFVCSIFIIFFTVPLCCLLYFSVFFYFFNFFTSLLLFEYCYLIFFLILSEYMLQSL